MVDGYDELPAEFQEKVDFALKNGHIPDEDCTRVSIFTCRPRWFASDSLTNRIRILS